MPAPPERHRHDGCRFIPVDRASEPSQPGGGLSTDQGETPWQLRVCRSRGGERWSHGGIGRFGLGWRPQPPSVLRGRIRRCRLDEPAGSSPGPCRLGIAEETGQSLRILQHRKGRASRGRYWRASDGLAQGKPRGRVPVRTFDPVTPRENSSEDSWYMPRNGASTACRHTGESASRLRVRVWFGTGGPARCLPHRVVLIAIDPGNDRIRADRRRDQSSEILDVRCWGSGQHGTARSRRRRPEPWGYLPLNTRQGAP